MYTVALVIFGVVVLSLIVALPSILVVLKHKQRPKNDFFVVVNMEVILSEEFIQTRADDAKFYDIIIQVSDKLEKANVLCSKLGIELPIPDDLVSPEADEVRMIVSECYALLDQAMIISNKIEGWPETYRQKEGEPDSEPHLTG